MRKPESADLAMTLEEITRNARELLASLPPGVTLVAAGKGHSPEEIEAAIRGGITIVGHNYVQEAEGCVAALGHRVGWHLIGHLQRNKVRKAAQLFDRIETIDSLRLGRALDQACADIGKTMPVLVEINIAGEENKSGANQDEVERLVNDLAALHHVRVEGLMTIGPFLDEPEQLRPHFQKTKELFDRLAARKVPSVEMKHLSMGMSDSFRIAIEEGATMVRIGTGIFGPREARPK